MSFQSIMYKAFCFAAPFRHNKVVFLPHVIYKLFPHCSTVSQCKPFHIDDDIYRKEARQVSLDHECDNHLSQACVRRSPLKVFL